MSSARKTLELLSHFSPAQPEVGLSLLCRLAGRDKATTYRHLKTLVDTGFVEQHPVTKNYRLGPIVLQLAQMREATVPRKEGAEAPLQALAEATGETAHIAILSNGTLYSLMSRVSTKHTTRVVVDVDTLPLHATASGLCALAFGPATLIKTAHEGLRTLTGNTPTTAEELQVLISKTRHDGIAVADRSMDRDVYSLAAPLFDNSGMCAGSVSVACVATRRTPELEALVRHHLTIASRDITRNWGGRLPDTLSHL